jgi:hypothetical protein
MSLVFRNTIIVYFLPHIAAFVLNDAIALDTQIDLEVKDDTLR